MMKSESRPTASADMLHRERLLGQVQAGWLLGKIGRPISIVGLICGLALIVVSLVIGPTWAVAVGVLGVLSATLSLIPGKVDRQRRQVSTAVGYKARAFADTGSQRR